MSCGNLLQTASSTRLLLLYQVLTRMFNPAMISAWWHPHDDAGSLSSYPPSMSPELSLVVSNGNSFGPRVGRASRCHATSSGAGAAAAVVLPTARCWNELHLAYRVRLPPHATGCAGTLCIRTTACSCSSGSLVEVDWSVGLFSSLSTEEVLNNAGVTAVTFSQRYSRMYFHVFLFFLLHSSSIAPVVQPTLLASLLRLEFESRCIHSIWDLFSLHVCVRVESE